MLDQRLRRLRAVVAGRADTIEHGERHDRQGFCQTVQGLKTVEKSHRVIRPHGAGEVVQSVEQALQSADAFRDFWGCVLQV